MSALALILVGFAWAETCSVKPLIGGALPEPARLCADTQCSPEFVAYAAAYADADPQFRRKFPAFAGKRISPSDLEKSPFSRAAAVKAAMDAYLGDRLRWKYAVEAYAALAKRCDDPAALGSAAETLARLRRGGEAGLETAAPDATPRLVALGAGIAADLQTMESEIRRLQAQDREARAAAVAKGSKDLLTGKAQVLDRDKSVPVLPAGPPGTKSAAQAGSLAEGALRIKAVPAGALDPAQVSFEVVRPEEPSAAQLAAQSVGERLKTMGSAAWKAVATWAAEAKQTAVRSWHGGTVVPVNVNPPPPEPQ